MRPRRLLKPPAAALAVLLGLLLLPGAAQSEPSTSCYSAINAARRGARLPLAATSAVLASAAGNHARYRVLADAAGLRDASAHYETSGRRGYTGVYPWDRTKAAGLRGAWAGQAEDMTTGSGLHASDLHGVQSWVDAPYHRFPLLDVNMRQVGCAQAEAADSHRVTHAAEVLEMLTPGVSGRAVTMYPGPGQRGVPTSFQRVAEVPTPFRAARSASVGYVVSIQASGYNAMKVSVMSFSRGGRAVRVWKAVRNPATAALAGAVDRELPGNAAMLAATGPLAPRSTYAVTVIGYLRASPSGPWQGFRRDWAFTTG